MPKEPIYDPRFQTENIAFDEEKMIACGKCSRSNPPNRLKCMYCGGGLKIADASVVRANLRRLEIWERGYNVILRSRSENDVDLVQIAAFLAIESEQLSAILDLAQPLPIARVESEKEAAIAVEKLECLGLKCSVLSDEALAVEKPPVRLSGMVIDERTLTLKHFNTISLTETSTDELVLIVPGTINLSRVDSTAKKGFRSEAKLTGESATATDEAILDIYLRSDSNGFRIRLSGFDFSCLGEEKGLLAVENMQRLIAVLRERAPNAKFVNSYVAVRQALSRVWDVESRKESHGVQHSGFGKAKLNTVDSTSNLNQFTKYSRLQRHLL